MSILSIVADRTNFTLRVMSIMTFVADRTNFVKGYPKLILTPPLIPKELREGVRINLGIDTTMAFGQC